MFACWVQYGLSYQDFYYNHDGHDNNENTT